MKKIKGFTLVELVIVIAIVIILSVVSVPIYRGYTDKAKLSEGYALVGLILSAQKNYFSEYGLFLLDDNSSSGNAKLTCNEEVLGIDARGNKYYTYFTINYDAPWTVGVNAGNGGYYRHCFVSKASAKNLQDIIMSYDITSGVTML